MSHCKQCLYTSCKYLAREPMVMRANERKTAEGLQAKLRELEAQVERNEGYTSGLELAAVQYRLDLEAAWHELRALAEVQESGWQLGKPPEEGNYIVSKRLGLCDVVEECYWSGDGWAHGGSTVTARRPLPEPYEESVNGK